MHDSNGLYMNNVMCIKYMYSMDHIWCGSLYLFIYVCIILYRLYEIINQSNSCIALSAEYEKYLVIVDSDDCFADKCADLLRMRANKSLDFFFIVEELVGADKRE